MKLFFAILLALTGAINSANAQFQSTNFPDTTETMCVYVNGNDVFVGSRQGVHRSNDDGAT